MLIEIDVHFYAPSVTDYCKRTTGNLFPVYLLYYYVVYISGQSSCSGERVTYAVCAGNANVLAITILLTAFLSKVSIFLVLSPLPWSYAPVLFRRFKGVC
jgi:Na+/melibiose symporter-like transporter